jgi:hypothetical protein
MGAGSGGVKHRLTQILKHRLHELHGKNIWNTELRWISTEWHWKTL